MKVLVVCKDLFFTARIGETAKLTGASVEFARSKDELDAKLAGDPPKLLILDLTTSGWDYELIFGTIEKSSPQIPILGFTTHALAKATQPFHARCDRVVTKETFTQELPEILRHGVSGKPA